MYFSGSVYCRRFGVRNVKKWKRWLILAGILLCAAGYCVWQNTALERTDYTVTGGKLPEAFDGFCIVQISDLHNTVFGSHNERLLAMIREAEPDIIAVTGDMIDSRRTDVAAALEFARAAMEIAPCYYVTGNHEMRDEAYEELEAGLIEAGVTVLRGKSVTLEREGAKLRIAGVDDPTARTKDSDAFPAVMTGMLVSLTDESYTVLLSHRPELFDIYQTFGMDLVLAGHTHGGQIRLPFIGGLYGSDTFFPEYDAGLFAREGTAMIVSRGLGNSLFPLRINNRPEVVVITLRMGEPS